MIALSITYCFGNALLIVGEQLHTYGPIRQLIHHQLQATSSLRDFITKYY